jgi:hypothetical protein
MEHWIGDNPLEVIASDTQPPWQGVRAVTTAPGLGIVIDPAAVVSAAG